MSNLEDSRVFKFIDNYTVMLIGNCPKTAAGVCFKGRKLMSLLLAAMFIMTANFVAWGGLAYFKFTERRLASTEKKLREQDAVIVATVSKLKAVRAGLKQVASFDTKLGYIIRTPQAKQADTAQGAIAPSSEDINLPLYRRDLAVRRLSPIIASLNDDIRHEEVLQQYLLFGARENLDKLDRMPSIWPVDGEIQSPFGYRSDPFNGHRTFHGALDIGAPIGTPVAVSAKGVVEAVGNEGNGLGLNVVINHGYGIKTLYAHLSRANVHVGQSVSRGDIIAEVGMSGRTTGPHLHYGVEVAGVPQNPLGYILN